MAALDASECVAALMQRRYCSVLRTADATAVASLADAYIAGGIEVVEFTMTCPHRFEHIKDYARRGDCLVGLGTCLTVDDAARGIAAGASFVVSPVFGEEVVRECVRQNKVVIPGCASLALAPLPLIFACNSEKSLCGTVEEAHKDQAVGACLFRGRERYVPCGGSDRGTEGWRYFAAAQVRAPVSAEETAHRGSTSPRCRDLTGISVCYPDALLSCCCGCVQQIWHPVPQGCRQHCCTGQA